MRCRKGGPLTVTDANLILGRLVPDYFPKIFGKSEKEPLDIEASREAFKSVAADINKESDTELGSDEIIYGYDSNIRLATQLILFLDLSK